MESYRKAQAESFSEGYAGLVALLVVITLVALISVFIIKRTVLPTEEETNEVSKDSKSPIQAAQEAKDLIERRNIAPGTDTSK